VPRIGGLGILGGVVAAAALSGFGVWPVPLLTGAALLLAVVSFLDDLYSLPFAVRLAVHLAAAAVWVHWAVVPDSVTIAVLAVLGIGWMTNLFNFMDGSDGLAGGMALTGFGTYALVLVSADGCLALTCAVVAATAAAFLLFNFHPASVFMGDAGSVPLGFTAGAIGVLGWERHYWPLWFPLLVFAPFILDATITLVRRTLRREPVWRAHREHYYQRLVRMGWGHRRTALAEYAAMACCSGAALALMGADFSMQWFGGITILTALICTMIWIDVRWTRFQREAT
jgi:UDP-N-acetylmuramyl pentapeptide phosphotransferase/UDP-N-acetylglucosamine-1-phosphate transferase